jgi:hypothetical protein
MRGRCSILPLGSFVLVLGVTNLVRAQSEVPSTAPAEALFREGRSAMKRGDYDLACSKFEDSQRQAPALGTLLNLALCQESRGKLGRAASLFGEFLERAPPDDDRRELVERHANELRPRVPVLILGSGTCKSEGCSVALDGKTVALGPTSTSLPVDPGEHVLLVSAPGRPVREVRVQLSEGQSLVETLRPGAAETLHRGTIPAAVPRAARPAPGSDRSQSEAQPQRTTAYVVGSLGAASLAASLVTGGLALARWRTVEQHCSGDTCNSPGALSANSEGRTFSVISTITFASGVLGLGAGTYLYLSADARVSPRRGQGGASSLALMMTSRF